MDPEPPARPDAGGALGLGDAAPDVSPLELEEILTSIRETAYRWDFETDRIDWTPNAKAVLGIADPEKIGKGRAFALLIDPEHAGPRYDGITGGPHAAPGSELRYCLRYRFLPEGRRGRAVLWVEDTGVCSIDAEGQPRLARGTLRAIDGRREKEDRPVYFATHDELTGQLNRTKLTEELTRFLGNAGRTPTKGAFLLAGVNDLTLINETYGYDVGDEVITIVGRRIARALRGGIASAASPRTSSALCCKIAASRVSTRLRGASWPRCATASSTQMLARSRPRSLSARCCFPSMPPTRKMPSPARCKRSTSRATAGATGSSSINLASAASPSGGGRSPSPTRSFARSTTVA